MRLTKRVTTNYEGLLKNKGEENFYRYVIGVGFMARTEFERSDVEILNKSEAFFTLFRQTGNEIHFTIGKLLRKAAHRLYRDRIKQMESPEVNGRFLNLIK